MLNPIDKEIAERIKRSEYNIRRLEDEVLKLRGDRLEGSSTVRGSTGPTGPPGASGLSSSDILELLSRALIFQEQITTSPTTVFHTTYPPKLDNSGNPLMALFLNGTRMRRGATGNMGWSFTDPDTITTIRTMATTDVLVAHYLRKDV